MVNKIVMKLLSEHEGGTKFFDALDEMIRGSVDILDILTYRFLLTDVGDTNCDYDGIIVSGRFGRVFSNYYIKEFGLYEMEEVIAVNGGLRKDTPIDDLSYLDLDGKDYIFVDDSFYSGKTRDVIKAEVERLGGRLTGTYVVYDGSKVKDDTVSSIYRYYDNV